ncbi:MAG TPA: hypothetical protein VGQ05_12920, partial [Streptosporangiaceae bacterium]|nr:hypothetical protein [Streptosporangiaceae bacterium]
PIVLAASLAIGSILRSRLWRRSQPAERSDDWITRVRRILLVCFIVAIPIVLIGLPVIGLLEGEEAVKGYTVRNVYPSNFLALPVLAVEAVPARIYWISPSEPGQADISARQCLLYLGQANGTSVFYDVYSEESIRLPSADIIVTLQDTTSVPIGC